MTKENSTDAEKTRRTCQERALSWLDLRLFLHATQLLATWADHLPTEAYNNIPTLCPRNAPIESVIVFAVSCICHRATAGTLSFLVPKNVYRNRPTPTVWLVCHTQYI